MWAATAAASASSPAVPPPPRRDYASLFARGKNGGCPPLFLAPMEGLGDARLRRSLSLSVGGFDEACREFTRVPGTLSQGAKAEKLLRGIALNGYDAEELSRPANASVFDAVGVSPGDVAESNRFRDDDDDNAGPPLLAAQLMGSNPDLLEHCARVLARETRAPRVDLNCGCPANVVTGKGAGSSLLRDPNDVYACVSGAFYTKVFHPSHRSVSTFDRVPFQLTGKLFLYGMALSDTARLRRHRVRADA